MVPLGGLSKGKEISGNARWCMLCTKVPTGQAYGWFTVGQKKCSNQFYPIHM